MSTQTSDPQQANGPKFLPVSWLVALVAGLCIIPVTAGTVAQEIGGWLGVVIWFTTWGLMAAVSVFVTYHYANPNIPIVCGTMVGITAPRPSDEWIRQITPEKWLKAAEIGLTMVLVMIGMSIFTAIARRHKPKPVG